MPPICAPKTIVDVYKLRNKPELTFPGMINNNFHKMCLRSSHTGTAKGRLLVFIPCMAGKQISINT